MTPTGCPTTCTNPAAIVHSSHPACRFLVFAIVCPVPFPAAPSRLDAVCLFTRHLHRTPPLPPASFTVLLAPVDGCLCCICSVGPFVSCPSCACTHALISFRQCSVGKAHVHLHLHHRSATPPRSFTPRRGGVLSSLHCHHRYCRSSYFREHFCSIPRALMHPFLIV